MNHLDLKLKMEEALQLPLDRLSRQDLQRIATPLKKALEKLKQLQYQERLNRLLQAVPAEDRMLFDALRKGKRSPGKRADAKMWEEYLHYLEQLLADLNRIASHHRSILDRIYLMKEDDEAIQLFNSLTNEEKLNLSFLAGVTREDGSLHRLGRSRKTNLEWFHSWKRIKTRGRISDSQKSEG